MAERFISPCKPPEGREREILEIMAEECAEVIQRITKALRFGLAEIQPGQELSNAERIGRETGDLLAMVDLATQAGLIPQEHVSLGRTAKGVQLAKYMQHQEDDNG